MSLLRLQRKILYTFHSIPHFHFHFHLFLQFIPVFCSTRTNKSSILDIVRSYNVHAVWVCYRWPSMLLQSSRTRQNLTRKLDRKIAGCIIILSNILEDLSKEKKTDGRHPAPPFYTVNLSRIKSAVKIFQARPWLASLEDESL